MLKHGSPTSLGQMATPVIVGWFVGHIRKNNNNWYTQPPKLLCKFYTIYTICKCGNGLRNTIWQAASWRPMCYRVVIKYLSGICIHTHPKHASHNASDSLCRISRV